MPARKMAPTLLRIFAAAAAAAGAAAYTYDVAVSDKGAVPVLSIGKAPGQGHSNCTCTFNPAAITDAATNTSILVVRASGCSPAFGGSGDHLMYAVCDLVGGTCADLTPDTVFPWESDAEDPRTFFDPTTGFWYLYYFASGPGQNTVYLRRSRTPLDVNSWELVASQLPWHRNGCTILREDGNHFGEGQERAIVCGERWFWREGRAGGLGLGRAACLAVWRMGWC